MTAAGAAVHPRDRFFLWMAAYCVLLAFAGFTPTYWAPMASASLERLRPVVHLHGAVFFSWMMLFLVQSWLITRARVVRHRSLGLVGISLATAMLIFGFIVSLAANVERIEAGQTARAYDLGFSNSVALLSFAILFALAILKRRSAASHKRLMLFATAMILTPAVGRLYRPVFAPSPPSPWVVFVTIDLILVACIWYDLRILRHPHPVTIAGGAVLVAFQVLRFPIPRMEWWHSTYDLILRLAA